MAGYGWSNSDTLTKSPWPSSSLSSWMTWIYSTPTSQRSGHSLNEKENMITISPELPDWNTLPWNYPQLILSFDRFLDDSIPAHMWSNHTTQHSTKQDKTQSLHHSKNWITNTIIKPPAVVVSVLPKERCRCISLSSSRPPWYTSGDRNVIRTQLNKQYKRLSIRVTQCSQCSVQKMPNQFTFQELVRAQEKWKSEWVNEWKSEEWLILQWSVSPRKQSSVLFLEGNPILRQRTTASTPTPREPVMNHRKKMPLPATCVYVSLRLNSA